MCGVKPQQFNTLTFNGLGCSYIYNKTTIACYGFATDNYLYTFTASWEAEAHKKEGKWEGTGPEDLMVFDNVTLASMLIKQRISSTMPLKRIIVLDLFSTPSFSLLSIQHLLHLSILFSCFCFCLSSGNKKERREKL